VKYIPAWFPGAGFKRVAAGWKEKVMRNVNMPFERVKANMVRAKHHLQKMVPT